MLQRSLGYLDFEECFCATIYCIIRGECGILNRDETSGTGIGTHWVAWHRRNGKNYYFDSYGIQPPNELTS